MYELFLLGKLLARPWYGYEFQQALSGFFGRRVSWGTIYPLFQRLEREGLIREKAQPGSRHARDKQAYAITASGKKRFVQLMSSNRMHDPDFREIFRMKLAHLSRVEPEIRKQLISSHQERLAAILSHTSHMITVVEQITTMTEEERELILLAIDHEQSLAQSELIWVRKHLKELEGHGFSRAAESRR